jgi:hypothetical protein
MISGYCGCSPNGMEKNISEYGRLHEIKNENVDRLKSDKKPCKYLFVAVILWESLN